jgi:hypothetical protein
MRWKQLNGVASSMLQKFANSAEHIAYLAQQQQLSEVEIDWLAVSFNHGALGIDRNRNLVEMCRDNLVRLIPITDLQTAHLQITYQRDGISNCTAVYTLRLALNDGRHATATMTLSPQRAVR